jgi:hypothetical protein
MSPKTIWLSALILCLVPGIPVEAQTCSCGGAPLLNSLEIASTPARSWHLGLTYEHHAINDFVHSNEPLDYNSGRRTTNSALLGINYGLTDRWSISALTALVRRERKIAAVDEYARGDLLRVRGVGDALFLLKYTPWRRAGYPSGEAALGAGFKAPLGSSGVTSNGIAVSEDMQPGTGSWDGIIWGTVSRGLSERLPLAAFASLSYRRTGVNERDYRFGDDLIFSPGLSYQPAGPLTWSVIARYRWAGRDRRAASEITNTGGRWFYLVPGVNFGLSNGLSFRLVVQVPVYRKLNGFQLTTSYSASLAAFYVI